MNIKPSWDTAPDMPEGGILNATPQKQQSPLDEVSNGASDSIIEAIEEYTVQLFNNKPLHGAMVKMMGGCPVEIRRSVIENATQYGESNDNALYGLAVFDLYNEHLQPTGAVFTNPTIEGFKDIVFGHGGVYFNRSKLNKLPLIVTDDAHLAFKTTYPVYAPYQTDKIKAYTLKALMQAHPNLFVIAPVHQQDDIKRRYTDLDVKLAFIPEPPNFAMPQDELDCMIKAAVEKANGIEWGEPELIKAELLPVQQLTRDMLPTDLSEYVFDNAERADHMPNDFVAVSLLTCLGGLIGARVSIKPKQQDDWEIVPNLWGGIVGNPSMKKSPAFNAGSKPLNNLVMKAKAEAKQKKGGVIAMPTDEEREKAKQAIIEKQKIALEIASKIKVLNATIAHKKTTEDEREKAIANLAEIKAEQEIVEQMQNHADDEAIPEKRYLTNDTSPEALTDLEINNPNGIIIIRDELIGLLSSLTRNGEDTGRAFYLEGWNGTGSYQYDRIVRGAGYIPNHCITLLGGIQPDKLITYLESTVQGAGNDGLLQRFQLLVYPDAPTWKYEDRYPNKDARSAVYELFEAIDSLKPSDLVKMGAKPADQYNDRPYFRFSESAQTSFIDWFTELNAENIANEEHAIIQEHLSKYGKLMPALALIFHIIDGVNFGNVGAVSKASAEMAIQWCEYLEKHARRIYGLVLNSSELRASVLALKLQQLPIAHEWLSSEGVTASQILRKNWKHLTTIEGVYDALDVLTDKNWLRLEEVEPSVKGGRPKKRFLINKKIFLAKNT